jgi:hypothetical protein
VPSAVLGARAVASPLLPYGLRTVDGTYNNGVPGQSHFGAAHRPMPRAKNQPGPDGIVGDDPSTAPDESADDIQDATNTDTPWVDQQQTYSSHSSHQVFLRAYKNNSAGRPAATGRLIEGDTGGQATWKDVKAQAASLLGLELVDTDALNIPMLATDEYGRFLRGPDRGLPQFVTDTGLVEGNTSAPVAVPAGGRRINVAFLDDIAHDAHFMAGDGRVNENIALTAIHQVFHSEHNRLIGQIKGVLEGDTSDTGVAALAEWKLATGADGWNGERLFKAARFVTEMEYQHLVFEEFARKVQPAINRFNVFTQSDTGINPAIKAEFAHAVYRFGHSMLTDTVARTNEDGSKNDMPLIDAFVNPPAYYKNGSGAYTPINMTRAREAGVPSLNNFRKEVYRKTNDTARQRGRLRAARRRDLHGRRRRAGERHVRPDGGRDEHQRRADRGAGAERSDAAGDGGLRGRHRVDRRRRRPAGHAQLPVAAERPQRRRRVHERRRGDQLDDHARPGAGQPEAARGGLLHRQPRNGADADLRRERERRRRPLRRDGRR